ncbi:MAG: heat-inducible transcription repressor HrcA [Candidatus Marinimicrobia bacterium]|nr:heat-inducible transcription repressor HrcA [Candidatus Neomarinimicrobiota bacterium]
MIHNKNIHLTERETTILKFTVEEFIVTNRPIGSSYLKKHHRFNISPATIRNTLSVLESKGLVMQPHTSSGRIPTDLGYRYYVDCLMDTSSSNLGDVEKWSSVLKTLSSNIEDLMQATATMLAKASQFFGVVLVSQIQRGILKDIEFISLSSDRIMVVLAMESGIVRSMVFNLKISIRQDDLRYINQILNEQLTGHTLEEIQATVRERLHDTTIYNHEIVQILIRQSKEYFTLPANNLIFTSTNQFLLMQPEFQQIDIIKATLHTLEKQKIKRMLMSHGNQSKETMIIGRENSDNAFKQFSVLSTGFQSEYLVGQLAVLGPTRIPYKNIKTILEKFSEIIPHVC